MSDRAIGIFLIVTAGWFVGYMHHFVASRAEINELREQSRTLAAEVRQLSAEVSTVKKVRVKATAYSNDPISINVPRWRDGLTATNKKARRGVVAADWRLFPPGTRLYVPGYGEAVVEDQGSAVKGYHLDLFVDSRHEALDWGVKSLDVYVIEKGKPFSERSS